VGVTKLFLLINPFGHLEHLICETLKLVAVTCLVLSLVVEIVDAIQEAFKFTRPRPLLLVASQSFHRVDGMICFPLLLVGIRQARLVHVARLLLLPLFSCVEGRLLGQGIFVSDGEHCF
jgi:hypothetical protein